jgi:acyl-CoA synthetase (AMP-forming)/AMP-acid ligase II
MRKHIVNTRSNCNNYLNEVKLTALAKKIRHAIRSQQRSAMFNSFRCAIVASGINFMELAGFRTKKKKGSHFSSQKRRYQEVIMKVLNSEGKEAGVGEEGKLAGSAPNIMQVYFKDEETTKMVLDQYGGYHTGDMGYRMKRDISTQ